MVEQVEQLATLNEREQAGYFYARARTRSFRDVSRELFRTHDFGVEAATVSTAAVFPSAIRSAPVTFSTTIEITGAAAAGLICEFGDNTNGLKIQIAAGNTFGACAGNATAASVDGVDATQIIAGLGEIGSRHHIVVAVNPGNGKLRAWVNGVITLRAQAATPPLLGTQWSSDADGSVGAAQATSSTLRLAETTAPTDFALVAPFRVFARQLPRHFD